MLALVEMTLGLAVASAPQVDLQWQAPTSCPSQADIRGRLQSAGAEQGRGPLQATATIRREGPRFHLILHLRAGDREQSRNLEDGDCSVLADAVVLMIAAHTNPEPPQTEPKAPKPAPQPTREAPQVPEPTAPGKPIQSTTAPGPAITARRPPRAERKARGRRATKLRAGPAPTPARGWSLGGHGGLSGALWPGVQARVDLEATYAWQQWALEFGAGADLPREQSSDRAPERSALITMLTVPLRMSFQPGVGPVSFPITVGAEFGALYVAGRAGFDRRHTDWHWWGMAVAGLGLRVQVHQRMSLRLRGEANVPWQGLELVAGAERTPLFRLRPLGFRVVLGADIHFPQRKRRAN